MKPASLAKPYVLSLPEYVPGKPIDDVARDLGLDPSGIIKLASNENAFGPSPLAAAAARRAIGQGQLYPDGECFALRAKLAASGFYTRWRDKFGPQAWALLEKTSGKLA